MGCSARVLSQHSGDRSAHRRLKMHRARVRFTAVHSQLHTVLTMELASALHRNDGLTPSTESVASEARAGERETAAERRRGARDAEGRLADSRLTVAVQSARLAGGAACGARSAAVLARLACILRAWNSSASVIGRAHSANSTACMQCGTQRSVPFAQQSRSEPLQSSSTPLPHTSVFATPGWQTPHAPALQVDRPC
jgi:hypothetical protein